MMLMSQDKLRGFFFPSVFLLYMPAASSRPEKPEFKATSGSYGFLGSDFTDRLPVGLTLAELLLKQSELSCTLLCPPLPPSPDLYSPAGQSTANPKSLPASPWRQASVEQMASVCRAAIKEEETSGEMKVGQDGTGWGGARRGGAGT